MASHERFVHDAVHGTFKLPEEAWIIIDTPTFQRLRDIKQTGNTCYVYPSAEHSRFQHCLGVAHLATEFGRAIKFKYPDLITDEQILLLCLAGLCHDLGHCAYSHLYDNDIIPLFGSDGGGISSHEEASVLLLEMIYYSTDLQKRLDIADIETIGKMILGSEDKVPSSLRHRLVWSSEDHENTFLYEIVSNSRTGIDVDKFDYLKRDCHHTGVPCTFDPQRLMMFFSWRLQAIPA